MKKSILLGAVAIAGTLAIGVATGFAADPVPPPPGPGAMGGPPPHGLHGRHAMLGGDFMGPLAYDMKKNGQVTKAEVEAQIKKRFEEADTNHNGKLSLQEIQAWRKAERERREQERIKRFDARHNGGLTLSEIEKPALAHFDRLDTNHNGVVSKEEIQAARAKWREKVRDWRGHHMRRNGPPQQQQ